MSPVAKFQINIFAAPPFSSVVKRLRPRAAKALLSLARRGVLFSLIVVASQQICASPLVIDQRLFHSFARSYSAINCVFFVSCVTVFNVQARLILFMPLW